MMKWFWRRFRAPGDDEVPLPATVTGWHHGRDVSMLDGHWNTIIQYASRLDPVKAEQLDLLAQSHDDDDPVDLQAVVQIMPFVDTLLVGLAQQGSAPMMPAEDDPDGFEASIYRDILLVVKAVFEESLRLQEPYESWLDYT